MWTYAKRSRLLLIPFLLLSCSSDSTEKTCAPGDVKECPCPGGAKGTQTCSKDGTSWDACLGCPATTPDSGTPPPDATIPPGDGPVATADAPKPSPDSAPVECQTVVSDDFSQASINTSVWTVAGGTWTQVAGQLKGHWSLSAAQTDQGNLLLVDAMQPTGDYVAEFDGIKGGIGDCIDGYHFTLYNAPGKKYNVAFGFNNGTSQALVEVRDGGTYTAVVPWVNLPTPANNTPGAANRAKLVRSGNTFTLYVNGVEAASFVENAFGGSVKIGLGTYGTSCFDNFTICKK